MNKQSKSIPLFQTDAEGKIHAAAFKDYARRMQGVGDIGIIHPETLSPKQIDYWRQYLAQGHHAGMRYLEQNIDKRSNPRDLLPEAQSLIVILCPYYPPKNTENNPHIALYAQGKDYHKVIKNKLFLLASCLPAASFRAFCDTAPLLEKHWAWRAGLGYIGRNTLLIHPKFGSFCFIGILLTQHRFDHYDQALPDSGKPTHTIQNLTLVEPSATHDECQTATSIPPLSSHPCTNCSRCLQACPGHALGDNLDARRCFSYLTIENKGNRPPIATPYWFGCDICQTVCPANQQIHQDEKYTKRIFDPAFFPSPALISLSPTDIYQMGKEDFEEIFKDSALQRAGLDGLRKNIEAWREAHP